MKNNIRKYRRERRWSLEKLGIEVAKRTGGRPIGKSGISKWETGDTQRLSESVRIALSDIFDRPLDDIFRNNQPEIDYDGKILANGLIQLNKDVGEDKMPNARQLRILKVNDDSNEPALYANWLVRYYNRKEGIDPNAIDLPAVIKLKDGTLFVRKLQPGSMPGKWHLTTLNNIGKPIVDAELEWAAAIEYILPRKV